MKISVIMGHLNRVRHLELTLRGLSECDIPTEDVEVLIVESRSRMGKEAWQADLSRCRFPVRIFRLDSVKHPHENGCVPYNLAATQARGDVLVIQECSVLCAGDVLADIVRDPPDREWRSYGCYSADAKLTARIFAEEPAWGGGNFHAGVRSIVEPMIPQAVRHDCDLGWYGHIIHRPKPYYWMAAVGRRAFNLVGGFDLRYAHARGFEDDDILDRLSIKGAKVGIRQDPMVVHLAHETAPHSGLNAMLYRRIREERRPIANGGLLDSAEYPAGALEDLSLPRRADP